MISRRKFIGGTAALAVGSRLTKVYGQSAPDTVRDLSFINGRIHTMDANNRVFSQALIRNGRIVAVGDALPAPAGNIRVVNLMGKTVIPGIIDAHNHIVLVGNRPGWNTPLEHVFTIPEAIAALKARSAAVPRGEIITTIGPISAMQFDERRLPNLTELDAVDRPVYIQAAQGGARINSAAKAWLEGKGINVATVGADGALTGTPLGLALQTLRKELLNAETRKRSAIDAMQYYAKLGITTHRDAGAFHSDDPSTGVANENTNTMHAPFLALDREGKMQARLRIDFLHQDAANANPPLPTLSQRLKNSFPFFGDEWLKTGGIGEFTGGGVDGLRAIAKAGWRAEDHALNLAGVTSLVANREIVNAETPITNLRWIISHIPNFNQDLANRMNAMGMGVLVGWGPTRTGTDVGPPYRMLMNHPIHKGFHSDGGDITLINPWLNFYTMITGKNLAGQQILGDQNLTRQETLWLATAANKWFIWEDDIGSIEVGNQGDLVVLDRDYFTVPDEDIRRIRSVMTVVGGKVVHDRDKRELFSGGIMNLKGMWAVTFFLLGALVISGQGQAPALPGGPAAPAAQQTGPGVQAPNDAKYREYVTAKCKNPPAPRGAGGAAGGGAAAGPGGAAAGGAAPAAGAGGAAANAPARGAAAPAAGGGRGGPTNPDGSPMHRNYKVTAIPGIIAEGATWKTVWTGRGNNADGPVATSDGGMLFAQNTDSKIMKLDKDGKVSFPYEKLNTAGSVSINKKGEVFVLERGLPQDILKVAPKREILADKYMGEPLDCAGGLVNDMTTDSKGGVYFTKAGVHYADAKGVITKYGTVGGNGIILSPDEKTLYVTGRLMGVATVAADQPPSQAAAAPAPAAAAGAAPAPAGRGGGGGGGANGGLVAFDVQPDGSLKNERQFSTCACGDGSAVDAQGRIYSTGGGGVQVLDKSGKFLGEIPSPLPLITVSFGGKDKKVLYGVANTQQWDEIFTIPMISQGYKGRPK